MYTFWFSNGTTMVKVRLWCLKEIKGGKGVDMDINIETLFGPVSLEII